jgi:hypothetical protein
LAGGFRTLKEASVPKYMLSDIVEQAMEKSDLHKQECMKLLESAWHDRARAMN